MALVAAGQSYKQAGTALNLSEQTAKYHRGEVPVRLHLSNRAEVVAYALRSWLTGEGQRRGH